MDLLKIAGKSAQLELSYGELVLINNALNEILNGLDLEEFQTRVGVGRDDVQWLLEQMQELLDRFDAKSASDESASTRRIATRQERPVRSTVKGDVIHGRMRPEIARFHSPDVDDLVAYQPADPMDVGFLLQVLVGSEGTGGEESFDVQVCTPNWFLRSRGDEVAAPGRHTILITTYDWPAIEQYVRRIVDGVTGADWREAATELDRRLGKWEFAEYQH